MIHVRTFVRFTLRSLLLASAVIVSIHAQTSPSETHAQGDFEKINPALPTLFVAGDSTAAPGTNGIVGWGVPFHDYFDLTKVNVVNAARGGRSSRTFVNDGSWDKIMRALKVGDIVLIQFGHNDGDAINEEPPDSTRPLRARGSLPGLGEETQEIDNAVTKKHEVVHTYGWYMRKMLSDVKTVGATPILLSLTARNYWNEDHVERGNGRYGKWAAELARSEKLGFIDLTNAAAEELETLGRAEAEKLFQSDRTHPNKDGAELHARLVVAGLKSLRLSPVRGWLSPKGQAAQVPAGMGLDLPRPENPELPTLFLIGDSTVRNGRGDGEGDSGAGETTSAPTSIQRRSTWSTAPSVDSAAEPFSLRVTGIAYCA